MSYKPPYQTFKESQKRRKRYGPLILGAASLLFLAAGLTVLWTWFNGSGGFQISFLFTDTPTASVTPTLPNPTDTATPSPSPLPSETIEATIQASATASAPFIYEVESGDTLSSIAEKFDVADVIIIMLLNGFTNETLLFPGDEIIVPDPNTGIPTSTPLPPNLPAGALIDYFVLPGDTIQLIAEKFFSTEDDILEENGITNPNQIFPGQILKVAIRLITPTFGPAPTETLEISATP